MIGILKLTQDWDCLVLFKQIFCYLTTISSRMYSRIGLATRKL